MDFINNLFVALLLLSLFFIIILPFVLSFPLRKTVSGLLYNIKNIFQKQGGVIRIKKSTIVAAGSTTLILLVLFFSVAVPLIRETETINIFIFLILAIIIFENLFLLSYCGSLFFIELLVRQKDVSNVRLMTGFLSLLTIAFIVAAPTMDYIDPTVFEELVSASPFIVLCITVVLMSKTICSYMIEKGFTKQAIVFYIGTGAFVNYFVSIILIYRNMDGGTNEAGFGYFILGILLSVIALIINWKEIRKIKKPIAK